METRTPLEGAGSLFQGTGSHATPFQALLARIETWVDAREDDTTDRRPCGPGSAARSEPVPVAADPSAPLPPLTILFAANTRTKVDALLRTRCIEPGDAIDLVSGSPARLPLRIDRLRAWATELRRAYPSVPLFVHSAGTVHIENLAREMGASISGIYYDYEPNYEPEFSADFVRTIAVFKNVKAIVHRYDTRCVGYPTGRPLLEPTYRAYRWNYRELAEAIDGLVVRTQRYCRQGTAAFAQAVLTLLGQFAHRGARPAPGLQLTIGHDPWSTPNGVGPKRASECARIRAGTLSPDVRPPATSSAPDEPVALGHRYL